MASDLEIDPGPDLDWSPYVARCERGEWRAPIFRDMVLADLRRLGREGRGPTVLDIGCGRGFDDEPGLQRSLAVESGAYLGVEPDAGIGPDPAIDRLFACPFEEAPIEPGSVDLAFCVMVLEHLERPEAFWAKLREVLRDGGVFWGFTIDSRHWFARASALLKRLSVKDHYLSALHRGGDVEPYENYPVFYRSNTPEAVARLAADFRLVRAENLHGPGQLDYYLPAPLRPIARWVEGLRRRRGRPGTLLAIRAVK